MADDQDPITARISDPRLDTSQSDAAIDDIVAKEADEVLAAEDAKTATLAAENDDTNQEVNTGHPIFWTIIILLVVLALVSGYVLTSPGLELPFSS